MALFVNQENTRTKLQQKMAADLADKAKKKIDPVSGKRPDGVEDSAYLEDTKKTTTLDWVWVLIVAAIVGVIVWLVVLAI